MDREKKMSEQEARELIAQLSQEEKLLLREMLLKLNAAKEIQCAG